MTRFLVDSVNSIWEMDVREALDNDQAAAEILRRGTVGHLAFVREGWPQILPVNYVLDGSGAILFRSQAGTKLALAQRGSQPVSFTVTERRADILATASVFGPLESVLDLVSMQTLEQLGLDTWVGERQTWNWLRMSPADSEVHVRQWGIGQRPEAGHQTPDLPTLDSNEMDDIMKPDTATDLPFDHAGLQVLGYEECKTLLEAVPVGRIAFADDNGEICILPVNHALYGESVVFRTSTGDKMAAAAMGQRVAFEVDSFDVHDRTGWSVLVTGTAEEIFDEDVINELIETPLRPWADRRVKDRWVRIVPNAVTGRRIVH